MRNLILLLSLIFSSCSSRLVDRNAGRINPYQFNAGPDTSEIYKNSNRSKMLREDAGNFDSVISNKDMNQDENCFETVDERLIYTLYNHSFEDRGRDLYYDGKAFYSFFVNRYAHIEDYSAVRINESKNEYMENAPPDRKFNVIIPHDAFEVSSCQTQGGRTRGYLGLIPIIGWLIMPFIEGKSAKSVRLRPRINCVSNPSNGLGEIISNETHYCFRYPNVWMGAYDQYYFKLKQQKVEMKEEVDKEDKVTKNEE